jgi:RNA polymerase sigma factor (TIGR02999 family)
MDEPGRLTTLLDRAQQGDREAADGLFAESYALLRRLARARLRAHARTPTLDTGMLIHEVYLRFVAEGRLTIEDSLHFRRWAGRVMRSVIVDLARRRQAERRGGRLARITLTAQLPIAAPEADEQVLRVHEALETLAAVDARASEVVQLRYFGGMTEPEIAEALGVSERTVRRDWDKARLMLTEMMRDPQAPTA